MYHQSRGWGRGGGEGARVGEWDAACDTGAVKAAQVGSSRLAVYHVPLGPAVVASKTAAGVEFRA